MRYLQRETDETGYVTGQVEDFWTLVTAEQVSSVQTNGTKIIALHLFGSCSRAAKIQNRILAALRLNRFAFGAGLVLQLQVAVLIGVRLQVQFDRHGLLWIRIQVKRFRVTSLVVRSGIEQDVRLIWVGVAVEARVLLRFVQRRAFGTVGFGPGRGCPLCLLSLDRIVSFLQ